MKKVFAAAAIVSLSIVCDPAMSAETKKVPADELERQLDASLVEQGRAANSIDCPDELDKDKGAEVECTVIFIGLEHIMTVTFNEMDGDLINLQVTDEPSRVTPYGLAHVLETILEEQGTPADAIDCPDALDANKGAQVECAVVRNGLGYAATATSNGANGNEVDVHYAVAEKPNWWHRDWLARQIQTAIKEQTGTSPDSADCPDELDIDEGSELECTFVDNGLEFTVALTSNGGDIDLLTAEEPTRMTQEGLVTHVTQTLVEGTGQSPDAVDCPEEGLTAEVGETQRCMVSVGEDQYGVTVTITSAESGTINYDITRDK